MESAGHARRDLASGRGRDVEREVKEMSKIIRVWGRIGVPLATMGVLGENQTQVGQELV